MRIQMALWGLLAMAYSNPSCAQPFDGIRLHLIGGANYSYISNLQTTILSEPYFTGYTLNGKHRYGFNAGAGMTAELKRSIFAIGFDVLYSQQGSELDFQNTVEDFYYTMRFDYAFINLPLVVKCYPFEKTHDGLHGFNVGVGVQVGFNIAAENIKYTSGGPGYQPAFGTDLQEQQQLRNVLKGKNNTGILLCLGYDIPNIGIDFSARYHFGLSDVVETTPNGYNFIENKNLNSYLQVSACWEFFSTYPRKHMLFIKRQRS
jgi:hypothetical protein